ncbi:hypothetical protein ABTY63_10090 [Streptomyces solisilvae]|uniref:hypothetical protein n=1 Tax=Streptomyces malaysiensis TaxID=92644 RepID=UPI00331F7139
MHAENAMPQDHDCTERGCIIDHSNPQLKVEWHVSDDPNPATYHRLLELLFAPRPADEDGTTERHHT